MGSCAYDLIQSPSFLLPVKLSHYLGINASYPNPFGSFWLDYNTQFLANFDRVHFCYSSLDSFLGKEPDISKWSNKVVFDEFINGLNAGGSSRSSEDFWSNPQFELTSCSGHVVLVLMQLDEVRLRMMNYGEFKESNLPVSLVTRLYQSIFKIKSLKF